MYGTCIVQIAESQAFFIQFVFEGCYFQDLLGTITLIFIVNIGGPFVWDLNRILTVSYKEKAKFRSEQSFPTSVFPSPAPIFHRVMGPKAKT